MDARTTNAQFAANILPMKADRMYRYTQLLFSHGNMRFIFNNENGILTVIVHSSPLMRLE